jgi:DNA-directed RNA polymerase specialized sigma24 family protein
MTKESSIPNDNLLHPWLRALREESEEAAETELARLIETYIEPVSRGVIRFKLRPDPAEESDLVQEALTQWLSELRKLADHPGAHPIADVRGLAATISYRICYAWLRRRSPRRHALSNRLQYVLTRQAGLALWTGEDKVATAGFAAWRGRPPAPVERLRRLPEQEDFLAHAARSIAERQIPALLAAIFDAVGGPVALDELLGLTATLLQVRDEPPASTEEAQESGGAQFASGEDVAWQVEKRLFLARLWEEVRELPAAQRAALLFNLREPDGGGCLPLLQATGIATLRQIAEALELPVERFAELWPRLPLDDATIAGLLGLTRQQIINLRKSARERLARRLKGFF